MGLLGYIIKKSVQRATIRTIGHAAADVIVAKSNADAQRANAEKQRINAEIERINANKRAVQTITADESARAKPPRSSESYRDTDALEAVKELLGAGFVNITLKPDKRLSQNSKKYGRIRAITINGNGDFLGVRKVSASSKVVITYLDFKNGISEDTYTNIIRIVPGTIRSVADVAQMLNPIKEIPTEEKSVSNAKRYCVYCGELVTNEKARFCFACGKELE